MKTSHVLDVIKFLLDEGCVIKAYDPIANEYAKQIFTDAFSSKLFHQQLLYFKDIDHSESVTFLLEKPPTENEIKQFLIEKALTEF